jgi:DNA-binding transcriptional ArsR family regulator
MSTATTQHLTFGNRRSDGSRLTAGSPSLWSISRRQIESARHRSKKIQKISAALGNPRRAMILAITVDFPGLTLLDHSTILEVSLPVLSYHVDTLRRAELVRTVKTGRSRRIYLSSGNRISLVHALLTHAELMDVERESSDAH